MIDYGDVRILAGDARTALAELETASAQCVVTSPPFWGLRDYGGGELEIGAEIDGLTVELAMARARWHRALEDLFA